MTAAASSERRPSTALRTRVRLDETTAALVGIYFLLATLFAWQAWRRETPTIFTDELELTQLSRAIAETGWPARRGESYAVTTIVPWLTAPFWWIGSVATAYEVIKYVQALAMALAIFPAYGIARFVVSRSWALFAAAASIAAPALSYAPILVEEPWAYPLATTALWLTIRAIDAPRWGAVLLALGACVAAAATRSQLLVLVVALGLSLLALAWGSTRIVAWRASWTRWDQLGAVVLAVGIVLGLSALLGHVSYEWQYTTGFWHGRILEYGLWAGGAFAVGLGVLPVVALLSVLFVRGDDRSRRGAHAFVVVTTSAVAGLGWYAGLKGAYLSTKFSSLIVERNLVYLTPLAFAATAYVLSRARPPWWGIVGSGAFVGWMVTVTPIGRGLDNFPYYESHGLAILALANREWSWPLSRIEDALTVIVVVSTLVLLLLGVLRSAHRELAQGLSVGLATVAFAWTLTAEIYASIGEHDFSARVDAGLPKPTDWVDRLADGRSVVMLGQRMSENPVGNASTEFWNRSIDKVWSVDGTAPPPGPTLTPDLAAIDGTLWPAPEGTSLVLALGGVEVAGEEVGANGADKLIRIDGPIRLRANQTGIAADGWMVGDPGDEERIARAAYNRFDVSRDGPGRAVVSLSRETFCPDGVQLPGVITVRIGPLGVGDDKQPAIARTTGTETVYVPACGRRDVALDAPSVPWRVEVEAETFVPAEIDAGISERRELGALLGFSFVPS